MSLIMKTEEERAAEEYRATLSELNSNSKVEINALTMLAEDQKEFAVQIAGCIENQLKIVPNSRKLPVLYLIDSICKNYPNSVYVQLFTQNIVSNFCKVFEVSDEKVRKSLHKLRMTWNTTKIFPQKKLNAIDERVHEMDPNWPVLHKITSATQQRQQQQNQQPQNQQINAQSHQLQPPPVRQHQSQTQNRGNSQIQSGSDTMGTFANNNSSNNINNKRSTHGQQNGSRRKRVKMNRNSNNQSSEPVLVPPPQTFIDPNIIQAPHDLAQVHPTTFIDPILTLAAPISAPDPLHQVQAAAYLDQNLLMAPNEPQIAAPQILCTPFNQAPNQQIQEPQPAHLSVLESLYGGKQCSNCSLRFDDNNRYAIHLDWHFRQNLKSDNMFARRKWYYPLNLWVQFREINDDDQQENNATDSNTNDLLLSVDDNEVPTAPASKDDEKNICSVCHETFEKFWAEEEEEWRLRNAKLFEDERVYHPLCLIDMLQANVTEVSTCG